MQAPAWAVIALAGLLAAAPAQAQRQGGQPLLPTAKLKVGETTVTAELARTAEEQRLGLMHATHLPDNHGMLFLNEQPRRVAFWMRNTRLPLTIAYIGADGTIRELHDLQPFDETSVPSQTDDIAFVLEMNRHWFKMNGVSVGDRVTPIGTSWAELLGRPAPVSAPPAQ